MKKILLGISVLTGLAFGANAQDAHFSQYFSSPLTLNPALTGLTQCDVRVAANYRNQWYTVSDNPYTTFSASFDMATMKDKMDNGNALGIGVLALYDKAGNGGLQNINLGLSVAYHWGLGNEDQHNFSIGGQAVLVQKSIDFTRLSFEDQFNPHTGGTEYETQENFPNQDLTYPDYNAGIMYSGRVSDFATAYAGFSVYHLTAPAETFMDNSSHKIHRRYTATLGGSFDLNENIVLYASGMYQNQASASELLIGAATGFILNPGYDREYSRPTIFYLGAWYRSSDAIIPYLSIEMKKLQLGLSYDFNASSFSNATGGQGAVEFSLIFNGCINKRDPNPKYNLACPKF